VSFENKIIILFQKYYDVKNFCYRTAKRIFEQRVKTAHLAHKLIPTVEQSIHASFVTVTPKRPLQIIEHKKSRQ